MRRASQRVFGTCALDSDWLLPLLLLLLLLLLGVPFMLSFLLSSGSFFIFMESLRTVRGDLILSGKDQLREPPFLEGLGLEGGEKPALGSSGSGAEKQNRQKTSCYTGDNFKRVRDKKRQTKKSKKKEKSFYNIYYIFI